MTQGMLSGLGEKKNERENECQPDRTRSYKNIILANNENLNLIFKNNFEINKRIFFCFRFFYQNQYNIGSQSNTPWKAVVCSAILALLFKKWPLS